MKLINKGDTSYAAKNKLFNADIVEITLCAAHAVPNANFLITKNGLPEGKVVIAKSFVFKSVNKAKQQVFGYWLVPDIADAQGDVITSDEIEKAAYKFMENLALKKAKGTAAGLEHQIFDGVGHPIVSIIDPDGSVAKAFGAKEGIAGAWFGGVQVTNTEIWKKIEADELTGFSVGGHGEREEITVTKKLAIGVNSVFDVIKRMTGLIAKEGATTFLETYIEQQSKDDIYEMTWALQKSIFSILEDEDLTAESKQLKMAQTITEFGNALLGYVALMKAAFDTKDAPLSDDAADVIRVVQDITDKVEIKL